MKAFINVLRNFLIGVWIIVAIFITICLLSYNEFNIAELGDNTLLVIDTDELKPEFVNGDLVITKRQNDKDIKIGDKVFFYNGNKANEVLINVGKVTNKTIVTATETTFEIEGQPVSGEYVVGKIDKTKKMAYAGTVYSILISRWGYLFLVILPTLFALVYEITRIVSEAKKVRKEA